MMIEAKVLFLGSILFCGQGIGNLTCSPDGVKDQEPVRALVVNLTKEGYGCNGSGCKVCDRNTRIPHHVPYLVFETTDVEGDPSCTNVISGTTDDCPNASGYCCLTLAGHTIKFAGENDLVVEPRPDFYEAPEDPSETIHGFGWIADMKYFEAELELHDMAELKPLAAGRVVGQVDFENGHLYSMLLGRGEAGDSDYTLWKPEPLQRGKARTALAEGVFWVDEVTAPFTLTVVEPNGASHDIKLDDPQSYVVVLNLPNPLLTGRGNRRRGGRFSPHFKAYYNLFKDDSIGECRQPYVVAGDYFSGDFGLGYWLQGKEHGARIQEFTVEDGFESAGLRAGGDNAICSPAKFP